MARLTITEGLAEIKTLNSRIKKQQEFLNGYIVRPDQLKDPLEKDGGSPKVLRETMQSLRDLTANLVAIRRAIAQVNATTELTIEGQTKTIQEWLVWRKEVAPMMRVTHQGLVNRIQQARNEALKRGGSLLAPGQTQETKPADIIVNLDERQLSQELEMFERILGALDGQLSLKNATTFIEY